MIRRLTAATLGAIALLSSPAIADEAWYADFDVALKAAKAEGKEVLVDFTGSDWCGWCIRLHKEVFAHDEWLNEARKQYVLVALDFPSAPEIKAKVPNPKRNDELKSKYEIEGYPTILLMDSDGNVFGRTGYQAGGPAAYLKHMGQLRAKGLPALVAAKKLNAEFDRATGDARWTAWDKAAGHFESLDSGSPVAGVLEPTVRWALEADADNAKGAKARAVKALIGAGIATDDVVEAAGTIDPKNEAGLFDDIAVMRFSAVKGEDSARAAVAILDRVNLLGFKDSEVGFMLNLQAADWCAGPLADPDGKQRFALAAKAIGTTDPEMQASLDKLLK